MSIRENAVKKAEELGWKLLEVKYLKHPDDYYLIYTICERKNKYAKDGIDYCTHLFNNSINEFAYGHYDIKTYEDALEDLKDR